MILNETTQAAISERCYQSVNNLERYLQEYEQTILVVNGEKQTEHLAEKFIFYLNRTIIEKQILVLANIEATSTNKNVVFQKVSCDEQLALLRLYQMYDFSDRFSIFSDVSAYGNLLNYMYAGEIELEEIFDAIIC